jgi:hypothetical protein
MIINNKNADNMKSKWFVFPLFLVISFVLFSFVSQNKIDKIFLPDNEDSLKRNEPKVDVKVNKKFDENGNLIAYDSSYSIIYSSPGADIQFFNLDNDSVISKLRNQMKMNSLFENDTIFDDFSGFGFNHNDFFNIDPFENMRKMQDMMKKMFPEFKQDTLLIDPQKNQSPVSKEKPQNMITL